MVGPNKQTNKRTSIDTQTLPQCSHASVGLAQARPNKYRSMTELALFPGPTQLSVACSTEKALTLSFRFFVRVCGEPGNEAMTECELTNNGELCMYKS